MSQVDKAGAAAADEIQDLNGDKKPVFTVTISTKPKSGKIQRTVTAENTTAPAEDTPVPKPGKTLP
jgi:hypothetical protein